MKKRVFSLFPATVKAEELAAGARIGELPQQADESEQEYKAFLAFCMGGPSAALRDIGESVGMTASGISRLRKRRQWLARIERWGMARAQGLPIPTAEADWTKRQEELKKEEWELHQELVSAAREALDRWKKSGRVPILSEVAKLLELASRLGRLAAGLPLDHTEMSGKETAPIRIDIGAALVRAYGQAEVVDVETVGITERHV